MTKYTIKYTTQFKKDIKRAQKANLDITLLKDIVAKLANGEELDVKHKDHSLKGIWVNHRECHIQPDWLLIYKLQDDVLILTLTRTGSHSELFKK